MLTKFGDFLKRSKIPIDIEDDKEYSRVTIRIKHNGVSIRDNEIGKKIGTKKQFILKAGQFILSKIDARYGAFGIAPSEVDGAIITGNFWAYDVNKRKVNIEWFNQFTNSTFFYEVCERASSGITHRKYLDETFFLNYEIRLPSIEEQLIQIEKIKGQKIISYKLNNNIVAQQDLVKQLRQSFLREAMQGKLVKQNPNDEPASELLKKIKEEKEILIKEKKLKKEKELPPIKEVEIPFDIPDKWVWCRLGDILIEVLGGFAFDSTRYSKTETNNQVVRLGNVKINNLVLDTSPVYIDYEYSNDVNKSKLKEGDILITMTGTRAKRDYLFTLCLSKNDFAKKNLYLNQRVGCFRVSNLVLNKFVNTALKEIKLLDPVFLSATGAANQANVGINALKEILIPLPPLSEQNRIVEKLDQLMKYCNELESSIKESKSYNEQLLQQVLKEALNKVDM